MLSREFVAEEVFLDSHAWGSVRGRVIFSKGEIGDEFDFLILDGQSFRWVQDEWSQESEVQLREEAFRAVMLEIEEYFRDRLEIDGEGEMHLPPIGVPDAAGKYVFAAQSEAVA